MSTRTTESNGEFEMRTNPLSSAALATVDGEGVNYSKGTGTATEMEERKVRNEHVCVTTDLPHTIQRFLNIVLGREYFFVPIFLVIFCFVMLVISQVHEIRAFYETRAWMKEQDVDVSDYDAKLMAQIIPTIVFYCFLWFELVANICFGRWMAQSRHLEEFATRVCAPDAAGNPGKIDKATCMHDLQRFSSRLLPVLVFILYFGPDLVFIVVDQRAGARLDRRRDDSDDPDSYPPNENLSPAVQAFHFAAGVITFAISLMFYIIWYWICLQCYRYTQRHAHALDAKEFVTPQPLSAFIDTVSLLQEVSKPWSITWIVRAVSMFYRFYFKVISAIIFGFLYSHAEEFGFSTTETNGLICVLMYHCLTAFAYLFLLLATAVITGYVGDAFISSTTHRIRHIMGLAENDVVRTRGIEFMTMLGAYKGEAGLLFCGVEMSVEKAFYLVTAVGYINSELLSKVKDPFAGIGGDEDDTVEGDDAQLRRRLEAIYSSTF